MVKERMIVFIVALGVLVLVGCGGAVATNMNRQPKEKKTTGEQETFLAENGNELSREKAEKDYPVSNSESTPVPKVSQSIVNACIRDAESRFEDWFLTNYSSSYADLGLYNVRDGVRTQTTASTVSVAFEMEIGLLVPSAPTFSVIAEYSVENGRASLFSFDVH